MMVSMEKTLIPPPPTRRARVRRLRSWRAWQKFRNFAAFAIVLMAVRSAVADWNDVPTGSMKPTILEGDRIFVNKLAYDLKVPFTTTHLLTWGGPKRGDIVVFFSPVDGTRLVKRCIGLPGDTIELRSNQLIVNDLPATYAPAPAAVANELTKTERPQFMLAEEQYAAGPQHAVMSMPGYRAKRNFGPVTLGPTQYFMMGDNRDNSFDSRYFGTVERSQIVGHAVAVAISLDINDHWKPRWGRFFSGLK